MQQQLLKTITQYIIIMNGGCEIDTHTQEREATAMDYLDEMLPSCCYRVYIVQILHNIQWTLLEFSLGLGRSGSFTWTHSLCIWSIEAKNSIHFLFFVRVIYNILRFLPCIVWYRTNTYASVGLLHVPVFIISYVTTLLLRATQKRIPPTASLF